MNKTREKIIKILDDDLPWLEEDLGVLADKIISALQEEPKEEQKEPIYFDCTLAKFAEQLDVPLWKAMEFGKYFKPLKPNDEVGELKNIIENIVREEVHYEFEIPIICPPNNKISDRITNKIATALLTHFKISRR